MGSYSTAYVLSAAIKKMGEYDLVLAGRQAGDWDFGQIGLILAEILLIPGISLAQRVQVEDGKVLVEKLKRNGYEIRGCLVHLADAIKKVVQVPVITVGRINTPFLAEGILQEEKADLIALGRALIVDPEFPNKAREGRFDDIRMCIACNHCFDTIFKKVKITCQVNAVFGNEAEYEIKTAEKAKKVLVAGGGPAGLEAARVAALRGHKVILYEEGNKLGDVSRAIVYFGRRVS